MKFEDLLERYESKLKYVKRMRDKDTMKFYHLTDEYLDGYKKAAFDMFEDLKYYCSDFKPKLSKATKKDKKKYRWVETNSETNEDIAYDVVAMIKYRGMRVPVYFDDYGQQELIVIDGKSYGGGAYNINDIYDFCYIIDTKIDEVTD